MDDLIAVPPRGSLRSLIKQIAFQCSRRCMPSWHCIRASEPVKPKSRQLKKVARHNRRSNLPTGLRANTRSGHEAAHIPSAKGRSMRPMRTGSGNSDAVFDSSAVPLCKAKLMSSFGQGQAITAVTGSPRRAPWLSARACLRLRFSLPVFSLDKDTALDFFQSKALNIGD
jgi:hypothetical protein